LLNNIVPSKLNSGSVKSTDRSLVNLSVGEGFDSQKGLETTANEVTTKKKKCNQCSNGPTRSTMTHPEILTPRYVLIYPNTVHCRTLDVPRFSHIVGFRLLHFVGLFVLAYDPNAPQANHCDHKTYYARRAKCPACRPKANHEYLWAVGQ
jgi:hypothetical protein